MSYYDLIRRGRTMIRGMVNDQLTETEIAFKVGNELGLGKKFVHEYLIQLEKMGIPVKFD